MIKHVLSMAVTASMVLAVSLLAAAPAQAQTVLRFSNWIPPTHPISKEVIEVWAKQVEEVTKGAVKVQVLPPLGGPPGHYDMVRNGTADLAFVVPSYTETRFVLTRGPEMPFYAADSTSASVGSRPAFFAKVSSSPMRIATSCIDVSRL
jgi:TRAP-type C4-dicarboxylate transport system substrate-binding protein